MAQPQGQNTVEKSGPRTRFRTPRIQVTLYKSIMRKFGEAGLCPAPYPQNKQRRNPSSEQSMVNSLMDELSKIPGIDNSTKK
ncbi:TPA: hypothetical protein ACXYOX_004207 [Escherichia coli]